MKRRMHPFKHLFIILMLVIILFPLFWIITTSVRRDNAAFSTDLISNRLTLQHYKDLIINRKNIPQLITEMKKVTTVSSEYGEMEKAELLQTLDDYEADLKDQMTDSVSYIKEAEPAVEEIEQYVSENKKKVVEAFHARKNEELVFLQAGIEVNLDDQSGLFFQQALLEAFPEEGTATREVYIDYLKSDYKSFIESYESVQDSFGDARDRIRGMFEKFEQNFSASLSSETLERLGEIKQAYVGLIRPFDFAYKSWNVEVNLKGIMRLSSDVEEEIGEENYPVWNDFKAKLKDQAREIDTIEAELEETYSAALDGLNEKLADYEETLTSYRELEKKRKAVFETVNNLSAEIGDLKQELFDIENRFSLLDQQLQKSLYELNEARDLIESVMDKDPKPTADSFLPGKFNDSVQQLEAMRSGLEKIERGQNSSAIITKTRSLFNWYIDNAAAIGERLGYAAVDDAYQVISNVILPFETNIEDYTDLTAAYSNVNEQIEKKQKALKQEEERLDGLSEKMESLSSRYEKVLALKERSGKAQKLVDLSLMLQETDTIDEIVHFSNALSDFQGAYGKNDDPLNAFLNETAEFQKLIAIKESFNSKAQVLYDSIAQIEELLKEFSSRKETYVNLTTANAPVKVQELIDMDQIQKEAYNDFSSQLNKLGRQASDLAELEQFKEIAKPLTRIDRNIYESMQYWVKKPEQQFMRWLINTVILSVVTAGLTVIFCALGAYPFSRMRFPGRKNGLLFLLLVQMFPIVMGMVALYLLLMFIGRFIPMFGLDSLYGLGLIYLGNIAFNMWLLKGYFDTIPDSLEEAAMIDGSTRFQTFWRIVLPLAAPMLAVVFIIVFMANFNEFVLARVVLQSPENYTFAVGLQSFSYGPYQMEWGLFTAAALIGALPMVVLSLSMQRYLVSGLTKGSVKG